MWLALLAPFYPLSSLSLFFVPEIKKLHRTALVILSFYFFSQLIPAFFSPDPYLAIILTVLRSLLMFGLIGIGIRIGEVNSLKYLGFGLIVVYITALLNSWSNGLDLFSGRLNHPYMTSITLGIAGALGIWLAVFQENKFLWRLCLFILAATVLLLSGSRGPLLAAAIGLAFGIFAKYGTQKLKVAAGVFFSLILMISVLLKKEAIFSLSRLQSLDSTGRDVIWNTTLDVIRSHPMGGVGTYLLGKYLAIQGEGCQFFVDVRGAASHCPVWLENLGSPWLIAHSLVLQQLAETGPLGLLGLLILIGLILQITLLRRKPLEIAIVTGLLMTTVVDNTLIVPSPFFAEVFWIVAGIQLINIPSSIKFNSIYLPILILILSFPALSNLVQSKNNTAITLGFAHLPKVVEQDKNYRGQVILKFPPGVYRLILKDCISYCKIIQPIQLHSAESGMVLLEGKISVMGKHNLRLEIYPEKSSLGVHPLSVLDWWVYVSK